MQRMDLQDDEAVKLQILLVYAVEKMGPWLH